MLVSRSTHQEAQDEEAPEKEEIEVDGRDEYGCTPLHLALLNGASGSTPDEKAHSRFSQATRSA